MNSLNSHNLHVHPTNRRDHASCSLAHMIFLTPVLPERSFSIISLTWYFEQGPHAFLISKNILSSQSKLKSSIHLGRHLSHCDLHGDVIWQQSGRHPWHNAKFPRHAMCHWEARLHPLVDHWHQTWMSLSIFEYCSMWYQLGIHTIQNTAPIHEIYLLYIMALIVW